MGCRRTAMEMSSGKKIHKLASKMKKLLKIVIAPIFHLVVLPLKFLGTATCQTLIHFVNRVNKSTFI